MSAADYRTDPRWKAAQARYEAPQGNTPADRLVVSLKAAIEMHSIESAPPPAKQRAGLLVGGDQ